MEPSTFHQLPPGLYEVTWKCGAGLTPTVTKNKIYAKAVDGSLGYWNNRANVIVPEDVRYTDLPPNNKSCLLIEKVKVVKRFRDPLEKLSSGVSYYPKIYNARMILTADHRAANVTFRLCPEHGEHPHMTIEADILAKMVAELMECGIIKYNDIEAERIRLRESDVTLEPEHASLCPPRWR